jgi:hypothetical protein
VSAGAREQDHAVEEAALPPFNRIPAIVPASLGTLPDEEAAHILRGFRHRPELYLGHRARLYEPGATILFRIARVDEKQSNDW